MKTETATDAVTAQPEGFDCVMPLPVDTLVPHAGRMSLLSRVLASEGDHLTAEAVLGPDQLFVDSLGEGTGIGAWVGIELMAQAVAAWAGLQGRRLGQAPRIGLLLGSRRYRSTVARWPVGQVLRVEVTREFQADNGLGQFACRLFPHDAAPDAVPMAQAQLTVFGPEDPEAFLQGGAVG